MIRYLSYSILILTFLVATTHAKSPLQIRKEQKRQKRLKKAFIKDVNFGIGNFAQFIKKVQVDENGDREIFNFNPYVSAGLKINVYNNLGFYPELSITIPKSGQDDNISKLSYFFLFPLGLRYSSFLFRFGVGQIMTRISSDGGEQVLGNGLSETAFPMPKTSSTSRNFILNAGIEYFANREWSFRGEAIAYNISKEKQRAYNYTISVYFHNGPFSWD